MLRLFARSFYEILRPHHEVSPLHRAKRCSRDGLMDASTVIRAKACDRDTVAGRL